MKGFKWEVSMIRFVGQNICIMGKRDNVLRNINVSLGIRLIQSKASFC